MTTGWKPPARIRRLKEDDHQAVRDQFHIITEGDLLVPPVTAFEDLKMPPAILRQLASKKIKKPTPIQMQVCRCSAAFRAEPCDSGTMPVCFCVRQFESKGLVQSWILQSKSETSTYGLT